MEQRDYRLAAIVFTDIVGFSRMMERDETGTLALVAEHNRIITDLTLEHGGTVIKTVGDAFLLDFPNTVQAARCALAVQRAIRELREGPTGQKIKLRIGIHLGDIYFFENDAMGEGINIASRLQSFADPDTICISGEVYNLTYNKLEDRDVRFNDRGEHNLKNITRTIHVYEIRLAEDDVAPGTTGAQAGTDTPADAGGAGTDSDASASGEDDDYRLAEDEPTPVDERPTGPTREDGAADPVLEDVRRRVIELIRAGGNRPDRWAVINHLGITSAEELTAVDRLVETGLIRRTSGGTRGPEAAPWQTDAPKRDDGRHVHVEASWKDDLKNADWDEIGDEIERGLEKAAEELPFGGKIDRLLKRYRGDELEFLDAYRAEFRRQIDRERAGLRGHTVSFIGVNAMLAGIWFFTGAGWPWFLMPLLGWGIGYISNRVASTVSEEEYAEVEAMSVASREQLKLHHKLFKTRRKHRTGTASTIMTMVLLGTINILTTAFPWALFPVGFMAIGQIAERSKRRQKEREISDQLRELGFVVPDGTGPRPVRAQGAPMAGTVSEVRALRKELVREIDRLPDPVKPLGADFRGVLDTYVKQIEQLSTTRDEIDRLINSIPIAELEHQRRTLEERIDATADDRVAREYQRSLDQIDRQRHSYSELTAEQEMLRMRVETSVNALKQMKIDVARARSTQSQSADAALSDLRTRSREISQYLDDLRHGYEELDDPR